MNSEHLHIYVYFRLSGNIFSVYFQKKVLGAMKTAVGLITLANRLSVLNDQIPLDWPNQKIDSFKLKC